MAFLGRIVSHYKQPLFYGFFIGKGGENFNPFSFSPTFVTPM